MSNYTITVQETQVVLSTQVVGPQGPTGSQGPTGPQGPQGPSGVVNVTSPITNSGTSTNAQLGFDATGFVKTGIANLFTVGAQIIATGADAVKGLILKRNSASQSANLLSVVMSDGTTELARIRPSGQYGIGTQIGNAAIAINQDVLGDNRFLVMKQGVSSPSNNAIELLPYSSNTPIFVLDWMGSLTTRDITSTTLSEGFPYVQANGLFISKGTALFQSDLDGVAVTQWAPSTSYTKGDLAYYNGVTYRRISTGTSGSTFNTANWHQITPNNTLTGHGQLNSSRTLTNNANCQPVFVDNSGNVAYLNLEPDHTYFFEGWIQLNTTASGTAKNPSFRFYYIDGSGTALTPQSYNITVSTTSSAAFYSVTGDTNANTDVTIAGTTNAAAATYYLTYRGFIRTGTSTSVAHRVNLGAGQTVAGTSAGATVVTKSYINVLDMGTGLNAISGYWT